MREKQYVLEDAELGHHGYPGTRLSYDLMALNSNVESFDQANDLVGVVADYERNLEALFERMKI